MGKVLWPHRILTELLSRSKVGLWQTGPKLAIAGWGESFSRMRDVKFRLSSCVKKELNLYFPQPSRGWLTSLTGVNLSFTFFTKTIDTFWDILLRDNNNSIVHVFFEKQVLFISPKIWFYPYFELINVHILKGFFVLDKRSRVYHLMRKKPVSWETSLLQYVYDIPVPHAVLCCGGQINYGP